MKNKTYEEKLRDPRWQRTRLEKMQEADWRCEICGDDKTELHVHHVRYDRSDDYPDPEPRGAYIREPWEYSAGELLCLCSDCHGLVHTPNWKIEAFAQKYNLKHSWTVADGGTASAGNKTAGAGSGERLNSAPS